DEVDHLNARLEHLQLGRLIFERRRRAVNRITQFCVHGTHLVDGFADHVEHAPQRLLAHRHHHRLAQAGGGHAAHQALGGLQRDGADAAFADVLLRFTDDIDGGWDVESPAGDANGRVDERNAALGEFHVDCRSRDLYYLAFYH